MSKIMMFATRFPSTHPMRGGGQTYFVEKIWASLLHKNPEISDFIYEIGKELGYEYADDLLYYVDNSAPKKHTIRSGNRWKAGDWFSPRIWLGKPYCSKQIAIAPDIQVVRVIDIKISLNPYNEGKIKELDIFINNGEKFGIIPYEVQLELSKNDGLDYIDFLDWFYKPNTKPFEGQTIIWDDSNLPY